VRLGYVVPAAVSIEQLDAAIGAGCKNLRGAHDGETPVSQMVAGALRSLGHAVPDLSR